MGTVGRVVGAAALVGLTTIWPGSDAGADIVKPPGACVGTGHWSGANRTYTSAAESPGATIKVPRGDTVAWTGAIGTAQPGGPEVTRRPISGRIEVQGPPLIGWIKVDDWGGTSVRQAKNGTKKYDLPIVAAGMKLKLRGHHSENGQKICEGEINVEIDGSSFSNPVTYAGIAGTALGGLGLLLSLRAKAA